MKNKKDKLCFVIMPIGSGDDKTKWARIYNDYIKSTVENCGMGIKCERADSVPRPGSIISRIVNQLYSADIVIADLTDQNPNVYYELGIRHACSLNTILISQSTKTLPFDLKDYNVIKYSDDPSQIPAFQKQLIESIREVLRSEDSDNPIADHLEKRYLPFKHIIGDEKLLERESLAKEVWLITNDIYESEKIFFEVVTNNLMRDVRYISLVPKTKRIELKINQLRKHYEKAVGEKVNNYFHLILPPEEFPFFFEFTIYDPSELPSNQSPMEGRIGYLLVQSSPDNRRYVRLGDDRVSNVCAYFQRIWNEKYPANPIEYFPTGPYL